MKISIFLLLSVLISVLNLPNSYASEITVVDGDTLKISGITYRLHGIDAPEHGQKCKKINSKSWRCGSDATKALKALIAGAVVECDDRGKDDYGRIISVCTANGTDINESLVRNGNAWAFLKFSNDYEAVEAVARQQKLGVWQATTETPWDYRAKKWEVGIQVSPEGCPIKGNISKNGRIYHTPWSPWYSRTKITLKKGERWFCSEDEALDAGWRAPLWGT